MDTYKFMVRSPFTQEMFQETYWKRVLHEKRYRRNLIAQGIYLSLRLRFWSRQPICLFKHLFSTICLFC